MSSASREPHTPPRSPAPGPRGWVVTRAEPRQQATWELDARGAPRADAPSWRALTGQSLAQWQSEGWVGAVHPDERPLVLERWQEAVRQTAVLEAVVRLPQATGGWSWSRLAVAPVRGADGAAERWQGLALCDDEPSGHALGAAPDPHAETALAASERRLTLALGAARMGTWTLDVATREHWRDAHLNRMLGLSPVATSQLFSAFLQHIHPDDRATVAAAFETSVREDQRLNVEFRVVWPDGTVRWLRDQGDVFQASGGTQMAGACIDVTERRQAEEAVRHSEERLRRIVRSATDFAILTLTPDRTVTSWSPGAVAVFGYPVDEIIGRSGDLVFTPEDRAAGAPEKEVETARNEGRAEDERWHMRRDGSRFYASGVVTPLGPRGAQGFVKVARDLTDRKKMEDALREAHDRLEEKVAERTLELQAEIEEHVRTEEARTSLQRQLASVQENERRRVARDLHDQTGQLLAGLSLAIRSVADAGPLGPRVLERLAQVQQVADELGKQVHQLAVRLRPVALDDLGLPAALRELTSQWSAQSGVAIDVQTAGLDTDRLPIEIETVLYRVVQEGLTNVAKHAQASQVSVTISRHGGHATAVIEDNGRGFEPSVVGRGRLGLVGMRERVAQTGGHLEIESVPGEGTTLIAQLPITSITMPPSTSPSRS